MEKIEIGRCRDCKWWARNKDVGMAWGICQNSDAIHLTGNIKIGLETRENFGCIHWEEKEDGN